MPCDMKGADGLAVARPEETPGPRTGSPEILVLVAFVALGGSEAARRSAGLPLNSLGITIMSRPSLTILDGGMGRELLKIGAPFRESVGNDDLGCMDGRAEKREQDGEEWKRFHDDSTKVSDGVHLASGKVNGNAFHRKTKPKTKHITPLSRLAG